MDRDSVSAGANLKEEGMRVPLGSDRREPKEDEPAVFG